MKMKVVKIFLRENLFNFRKGRLKSFRGRQKRDNIILAWIIHVKQFGVKNEFKRNLPRAVNKLEFIECRVKN